MATEIGQLTLKVDTSDVEDATRKVKGLGDQSKKTTQETKKHTEAAAKSNVTLGNFGRTAGMAGVQFEQLAGQIAGGQNVMRAIGVQAADLGFILGVPLLGAVVGIGSAIASVMMPSLMNGKSASEELADAMERVLDVVERTETGSYRLSQKFVELAQRSRELAAIELAAGIAQAEIAYNKAAKVIGGLLEEQVGLIGPTRAAWEELNQAIIDSGGEVPRQFTGIYNWTKVIGEEFSISREQALSLILAFKRFQDGAIDVATLRQEVLNLAQSGDLTKESAAALVEKFIDTAVAAEDASGALEVLRSAVTNTDSALVTATIHADGYAQTVQGMIDALEKRSNAVGKTAAQLAIEAAETRNASDAEKQRIANLYAEIDLKEQEIATSKELEDQRKREEAAAERAAQAQIDATNRQALNLARALLTEEEAIAESYMRRKEIILASTQLTEEQKNELILRLNQETNDQLLELNQGFWDQWLEQQGETMLTFNDVAVTAIESFKQASGAAFEQMIFDSKSASDAVHDFAEGMLRSIVNALGQMAAEWVAYYLVQKLMGKADQAGAGAAMVANASATSLQAGIAAFASTAAIPIVGPFMAPGAMAAAIAATSPLVAAIGSLSAAAVAGRALGGQVRGGETYLVGERGPELLTMGGNGKITPNEMIRGKASQADGTPGGGTQLNVQVQNYGTSQISVERISETDIRIIAKEVADETVRSRTPSIVAGELTNPNSRVSRSLSQNTKTERRR